MKKLILSIILSIVFACANAKTLEVVYRIVEYNADNEEFVLAPCGLIPEGATTWFENDYGATYGNRYNQIPRNRQAALHLTGWQDCRITRLVFSMCSNNKSGTIGYSISDGETTLLTQRPIEFNSEEWYGEWVSKDLGVYVDITKNVDIPALNTDDCTITLKAGTPEGSVYINAITLEYEAPDDLPTQSPLGWKTEKMEKKSTLNDGDRVMLFRNGCAATDIDGMATSHYLDAVPLQSTSNVELSDILAFTVSKNEDGSWTLTDQFDRKLGAKAKQSLAWDEGNTSWNITLGYDGATIANANTNYGTMRYNAPEGSYARFWNYTSTSLQLPYLYRLLRQNDPTMTYSLSFSETEITVSLDETTGTTEETTGSTNNATVMGLRPTFSPQNTTDQRIEWTSSNTDVATVDCGYVRILSVGKTTITARTHDNGTEAQVHLVVTGSTSIQTIKTERVYKGTRKFIKDKHIIIEKDKQQYIL